MKRLSFYALFFLPAMVSAQAEFTKQELNAHLLLLTGYISNNVDPLLLVLDRDALYSALERIDIGSVGKCDTFLSRIPRGYHFHDTNKKHEYCNFMEISTEACVLDKQVARARTCKEKECSDNSITTNVGSLIMQGYSIKWEVNKCMTWLKTIE